MGGSGFINKQLLQQKGSFVRFNRQMNSSFKLKSKSSTLTYKGLYLDSPDKDKYPELNDIFDLKEIIDSFTLTYQELVNLDRSNPLPINQDLYSGGTKNLKFKQLVKFIKDNGFNVITIYWVPTYIQDGGDVGKLFCFLRALKTACIHLTSTSSVFKIEHDFSIIINFTSHWDGNQGRLTIKDFYDIYNLLIANPYFYLRQNFSQTIFNPIKIPLPPPIPVLFIDGFHYEDEFWKSDSGIVFDEWIGFVKTVRQDIDNFNNTKLAGLNLKLTLDAYIYAFDLPGNHSKRYDRACQAIQYLDRILVTAYKYFRYNTWIANPSLSDDKAYLLERVFHSAVDTMSYIALAAHYYNIELIKQGQKTKNIDIVAIFEAQATPFYEIINKIKIWYTHLGPWLAANGTFPTVNADDTLSTTDKISTWFKIEDYNQLMNGFTDKSGVFHNGFSQWFDEWLLRDNIYDEDPSDPNGTNEDIYYKDPNDDKTPPYKLKIGDKNYINLLGFQWFAYTDLYFANIINKP